MHSLEQLGGGKALHLLRIILFRGKAEAEAEHLLFGYMLVEQGVVTQSMACSRLTQRKRREPVRSTSRSSRLLVPMDEAMRGSAEALRL